MDSDNLQESLLQNYDWRTVLQQDARERIVNKIVETLKKHLPFSGQEGLRELKKIAVRFEEKIYTAATSQSDYLRKISLKMLTMETKSQNPMANSLQPNAASNSTDPQDPASQNMQSQMQNQVQQLPIPMVSNQSQAQQQLLSQNIQNNIPSSTGVPNSAGSTPALPPVDGKSQGTMPSVPVQSPNVQNTFNADPFAQRLPMMQGYPTNSMFQFQSQSQIGTDLKSKKKAFTSLKKVHAMKQSQIPSNEASLDSLSQTGSATVGDWQEDIYQKIKSMNEMYFPELNEMYQRMANKLQQHDAHPQQPKNEQLEKLRFLKLMLERLIMFLRTNKSDIQPNHKDKIVGVEKQILNILNSNRPRKSVSSLQQGQLAQPHMHAMQQSQQQQPQMSQMHSNEAQMNSQMQPMNIQNSLMPTQQNNLTSLQHNTLSSGSSVSNSRQSMLEGLPSGSNIDAGQGNGLNQMQQVPMNSLQQNSVGGSQQMTSSISSQNGLTALQPNVNSLQSNSNILQPQQIKQEQQMFSTQQLKQQFQQRQMHQQYMQRQQLIHQQQQQQQTSQQQSGQLPGQQLMQLNQMNDTNDIKMRHQMGGGKSGVLQQHNASGQRPSYHPQQMKSGTPFSMSSQSALQAASPQIGHHSSPQIDQQSILSSHTKAGTPLQSANSPFVAPSPSTSMAPSPMPGDSEKMNSGLSSISNAGNSMHHPTNAASMPNQSLAIGTPGISASPLLAEFTSPDGTHGVVSTIVSGNSHVVEQPLERLIKVVKSISPKSLSASVSDISSVVSMVDRIAGSAPGNGSRAAVGEDLVAMTKCRLQARNFFTQDGPSGTKKMRRYTSAMPCNVVSSSGSVNDNLRLLNGNESDGESTGASNVKRPRIEANHALEEELREINQRLIDTVVFISEDDVDPTAVAAASEGREGTIVKCSFSAVALSPNLKSQYASAQMSPIQPLKLLVPNNYPNCSPILLDKFPVEVSKEYEDLSIKAKSRFSISLRSLAQPMSLGEIAKTWDNCARGVISEYAQQSGGGTFSSKYGTWENCLSAA